MNWIAIKDGDKIPDDIMLVLLRKDNDIALFWKNQPHWHPIHGWTHYLVVPLPESADTP